MLEERIVGELMRDIRKKCGYTTVQLASRLNISQPKLSRIENGTQPVSISLLYHFCQICEIQLSTFFRTLEERMDQEKVIKEAKREYTSMTDPQTSSEEWFTSLSEKQKFALYHFIKTIKEDE